MQQSEEARRYVLDRVMAGDLRASQAAEILGISERHAWRLLAAYRTRGTAALGHGNRGRRPHNTVPAVVASAVVRFATTRYPGANHTHLAELLWEHEGLDVSSWTVRRILARAGIASPRRRRPPEHRVRRERMPREGMLLQVDGSHHAWLEDRGPRFALLLAVDDATGAAVHALFRPVEDARGYFLLLEEIVRRCGIPLALYRWDEGRSPPRGGYSSPVSGLKWAKSGSVRARGRRPAMQQHIATTRSIEREQHPALTIGLDIGDRHTHVCVLGAAAEIVSEQRVRTTEPTLTHALGELPASRVVLEAGPRSPWVSRLVADLGHEVIVANPRRVALIARGHRKTDRLDAEQLARLGRLDPALLSPIRHRSAESQQHLAVVRSRDALVRSRTQLINHVRGAVKAWGAALPGCTAPAFHRKAEQHIPAELRAALLPLLEVVGELTARIASAEREIEALCRVYPETAALRQVAGVGPITALTFVLTVEDPGRFPRNREVAAYLGLVPRQHDSGERQPQLGISKRGDTHLRRLLVQAAHYVLGPFGPDCDLRRWGERYTGAGAGNAKKRAVVAVARRLSVLLLALWKSGEVYEPLRHATAAATEAA